MAYKTITIDVETYELLKARKAPGQSFSAVIRNGLRRSGTGRDLAAALARAEAEVGESTLAAIDTVVASRRKSPARRVRL